MNRFGFLLHFLDTRLFDDSFLGMQFIPQRLRKTPLPYLPPRKYMTIGPICSPNGHSAIGDGIMCPILPEHFVMLEHEVVLNKIVSAVRIAEKNGARIVGLGGFTSVFGDEGVEVANRVSVPVTSGNTYTAALAVEGIYRAIEVLGRDLKQTCLAIIGATGDIGSICARLLVKKVQKAILVARRKDNLTTFAKTIGRDSRTEILTTTSTRDAIRGAEVILSVASAISTLIDPKELRPGSIVCDVAFPAGISRDIWKYRQDVLVFEGGMASWGGETQVKNSRGLLKFNPSGILHGCLAETILLALEGRYVSFSKGRGLITEEKIAEILLLAAKHGFRLAPFRCGDKEYTNDDFVRIKEAAYETSQMEGYYTC